MREWCPELLSAPWLGVYGKFWADASGHGHRVRLEIWKPMVDALRPAEAEYAGLFCTTRSVARRPAGWRKPHDQEECIAFPRVDRAGLRSDSGRNLPRGSRLSGA